MTPETLFLASGDGQFSNGCLNFQFIPKKLQINETIQNKLAKFSQSPESITRLDLNH